MISDVVLLKELPDFIKNNVDAYVGCLSGAIKKDEYLQLIEKAGFQQINVIDDTHFPVELIVNNSTGKTIIEKLNIPSETIKESASSVVSIKVQGIKQD